ncbi:MAG: signal peptidase II [Candidatus Woesearchaeota archaeon]
MVSLKRYSTEIIFAVIVLITVLIDQLTKETILRSAPQLNFTYLSIHLIKNTGAGFGLFKDQALILALVSLLVAVIIIYFYPQIPKQKFVQVSAALFLGGTIGNLIDRLFKKFVVDFIDFSFWPAFNLADAFITLGAIGLIIYYWKK